MRNEWSVLALVCACLLVPPAHAGSTADELARMESEHMLLKARLRMLETRAQIAARRADIDRLSATTSDSGALPTVTGIDGVAGKLQATVMMDNGHLADVRAGDTLPNGMKVVSIGMDGVTVRASRGKRVRLRPGVEPDEHNPALRMAEVPVPSPAAPPVAPTNRIAVMPPLPPRPGAAQ